MNYRMKPKVTVVVPVYNSSLFLDDCVNSIVSQNFTDFELILINDGSKDNSLMLCHKWASNHPNIRVYDKKNEGVAATRNLGIKVAEGDYICFIDSDDWVGQDYLECLYNAICEENAELVVSGINKLYNKYTKKYKILKDRNNLYENRKGLLTAILSGTDGGSPCAKLYKTSILREKQILFPSLSNNEDVLFNIEYLFKIERVSFVYKWMYYYRYNPQSLSHNAIFNWPITLSKIISLKKALLNQYTTEYGMFKDAYLQGVAMNIFTGIIIATAPQRGDDWSSRRKEILIYLNEIKQTPIRKNIVLKYFFEELRLHYKLCYIFFLLPKNCRTLFAHLIFVCRKWINK